MLSAWDRFFIYGKIPPKIFLFLPPRRNISIGFFVKKEKIKNFYGFVKHFAGNCDY